MAKHTTRILITAVIAFVVFVLAGMATGVLEFLNVTRIAHHDNAGFAIGGFVTAIVAFLGAGLLLAMTVTLLVGMLNGTIRTTLR
jgi:hypothetical protein